MTKICLNDVTCLAHDFIPSNLIVKLEGIAKVILDPKLDCQNNSFLSLIAKVIQN